VYETERKSTEEEGGSVSSFTALAAYPAKGAIQGEAWASHTRGGISKYLGE